MLISIAGKGAVLVAGLLAGGVIAGLATPVSVAHAAEVAVENAVIGASQVQLRLHPFLTEEEVTTLRLVQTNEQALALFVPEAKGFSAMAASPDDGVIRDGKPVASAVALAGFEDAAAAEDAALAACDKARAGGASCVVVLAISPAK